MRDDFSRITKETLSKRVGLHCSNPDCRVLTIGPNSRVDKTTNIGVAAHITAASYGGPRYDDSLTAKERSSISNAIWLCQSCAKLIDSDSIKYSKLIIENWKRVAEQKADESLNQRPLHSLKKDYNDIFSLMPELIKEMANDIKSKPLLRELILQGKSWQYNHQREKLIYYYEDHENLENKIILLENNGLLQNIQNNDVKRYLINEEFAKILMVYS